MTLVLELPEQMRNQLKEVAARRHEAEASVALDALGEGLASLQEQASKPKTGAELMDAWRRRGVVGAWKERQDIGDTLDFCRELRKQSNERIQE